MADNEMWNGERTSDEEADEVEDEDAIQEDEEDEGDDAVSIALEHEAEAPGYGSPDHLEQDADDYHGDLIAVKREEGGDEGDYDSEEDSAGSASPAPEEGSATVTAVLKQLCEQIKGIDPRILAPFIPASLLEFQGSKHTRKLNDLLQAGKTTGDTVFLVFSTLRDVQHTQQERFEEMQRIQREQFQSLMQQMQSTCESLTLRMTVLEQQVVASKTVHVHVGNYQHGYDGSGRPASMPMSQRYMPPGNFTQGLPPPPGFPQGLPIPLGFSFPHPPPYFTPGPLAPGDFVQGLAPPAGFAHPASVQR